MIEELIFTSAPKGLQVGQSGFCTVGCTPGMAGNLVKLLESLSGYRHIYPAGSAGPDKNPIAWSHVKAKVGGRDYSILSRVADAGMDYSGRSNKLAHHLAIANLSSSSGSSLSGLFNSADLFQDQSTSDPKHLAPRPLPVTNVAAQPCTTWQSITGDAGMAGDVIEAFLAKRPIYLIANSRTPLLRMIQEVLSLLPPAQQWDFTFTTYFTKIPPSVECRLRCVMAGTAEADQARRNPGNLVMDVTSTLPASQSKFAEAARLGRLVGATLPMNERVDFGGLDGGGQAADGPNRAASIETGRRLTDADYDYDLDQVDLPHQPPKLAQPAKKQRSKRFDVDEPPRTTAQTKESSKIWLALAMLLVLGLMISGGVYAYLNSGTSPTVAGVELHDVKKDPLPTAHDLTSNDSELSQLPDSKLDDDAEQPTNLPENAPHVSSETSSRNVHTAQSPTAEASSLGPEGQVNGSSIEILPFEIGNTQSQEEFDMFSISGSSFTESDVCMTLKLPNEELQIERDTSDGKWILKASQSKAILGRITMIKNDGGSTIRFKRIHDDNRFLEESDAFHLFFRNGVVIRVQEAASELDLTKFNGDSNPTDTTVRKYLLSPEWLKNHEQNALKGKKFLEGKPEATSRVKISNSKWTVKIEPSPSFQIIHLDSEVTPTHTDPFLKFFFPRSAHSDKLDDWIPEVELNLHRDNDTIKYSWTVKNINAKVEDVALSIDFSKAKCSFLGVSEHIKREIALFPNLSPREQMTLQSLKAQVNAERIQKAWGFIKRIEQPIVIESEGDKSIIFLNFDALSLKTDTSRIWINEEILAFQLPPPIEPENSGGKEIKIEVAAPIDTEADPAKAPEKNDPPN